MWISRFNPHGMRDEDVRRLATGRETLLTEVLDVIAANRSASGAVQHLLLVGPRGIGKSFMLRMVQVALEEQPDPPLFVMLPEEQHNIASPAALLDEIRRILEGGDPKAAMPRWDEDEDEDEAWREAVDRLDAAIRSATAGTEFPLLIAAVENFDLLLDNVFRSPVAQSRLRQLLVEQTKLMLIVTTLKDDLDRDYDERLFHAFAHRRLQPWMPEDYQTYFRRRHRTKAKSSTEAKIRALAAYTGGSPRMAVVLADLIEEGDPASAAETLDRLVDELTPYYQDLLDRMPPRTRLLFDALVRGGEPCSQSELAARLGTTQNRIAQPFAWLREHEVVFGERRRGGREALYHVAACVLVQYYRKRFILHGADYTPLAAMVELLQTFFTPEEHRAHALRLLRRGAQRDAAVFVGLVLDRQMPRLGRWARRTQDPVLIESLALASADQQMEALEIIERRLLLAELPRSKLEEARLHAQRGLCLRELERHQEAVVAHRVAVGLAREVGDRAEAAWNLGWLGWNLNRLGSYEEALVAHREASVLWRHEGVHAETALNLEQVGWNLSELCRREEALAVHREALELWRAEGDRARQAWNFSQIARSLRELGCHEDALTEYREASELWRAAGDRAQQAWNLGQTGRSLTELRRHEEALAAHREALGLWRAEGDRVQQAWNLDQIGRNLTELQHHEEALATQREALELWRAEVDRADQAWCLDQIAWNLTELGRDEEALATQREALELWRAEGDRANQAWCLDQIGWNLSRLGRHEEALTAHRKASDLWSAAGDRADQAWCLGQIAALLLVLGHRAESWAVTEQAGADLDNEHYQIVLQLSSAVKWAEERNGRSGAFALGREILEHFLATPDLFAPRLTLDAFFTSILEDRVPVALVCDLLAEARVLAPAELAMSLDAVALVLDYMEAGHDEAVLQRADPDLATAARTIVDAL
jgi:tetratricopeptide (TPR) repeat protein